MYASQINSSLLLTNTQCAHSEFVCGVQLCTGHSLWAEKWAERETALRGDSPPLVNMRVDILI